MRNTQLTFKITFTAILMAIIAVLTFTPLGMISLFGTVSLTTMFIPIAIGIVLLDDYKISFLLGFSFGLCSLIKASTSAVSPIDLLFIYPHISILPRVVASIVAHLVFRGFKKIINNKIIILGFIAGGAVALCNTIFTVSCLFIFGFNILNEALNGNIVYFIFGIICLNACFELVFGSLVTGGICKGIMQIESRFQENN